MMIASAPSTPGRPQQRPLTGGERAPAAGAADGCRSAGRGRGAVGGRPVVGDRAASGLRCRRDGGGGGPADGRRLVGPRWPAAGAHRGDGVGERAAGAVALPGFLEQA